MGNANSMFQPGQKVVPGDYQLVGKVSPLRWGELFEMKNTKSGLKVLMQEKHAIDLESYNKIVEDCTYYISLVHRNFSTIYGFTGRDTPDAFTNTYKVCIFFEHVEQSLQQLIKSKRFGAHQEDFFDEYELLRFLTQLVDVYSFLQRNGINQGDITPDVCFITKEGVLKVVNRKLIYSTVSTFEMAQQGVLNVFPTPRELEALGKDEPRPQENRYKADVFRLGMTLLECATLKRSAQLYDWNKSILNIEELSNRLIEVNERYSGSFYDPLREMLRFEEHKRPDFLMLHRFLQEKSVKNLTNSVANKTPLEDEENYLKKSIFGMGPKLAQNQLVNPGVQLVQGTQNVNQTSQPRRIEKGEMPRANREQLRAQGRKEEDLDDTGDNDEVTVNKVLATQPRNSFDASRSLNRSMESPYKKFQKKDENRRVDESAFNNSGLAQRNSHLSDSGSKFQFSLRDFVNKNSASKMPPSGFASPKNNPQNNDSMISRGSGKKNIFTTGSPPPDFYRTNDFFSGNKNFEVSTPKSQQERQINMLKSVGMNHDPSGYPKTKPFQTQEFVYPFQDPTPRSQEIINNSSFMSDYQSAGKTPTSLNNLRKGSLNLNLNQVGFGNNLSNSYLIAKQEKISTPTNYSNPYLDQKSFSVVSNNAGLAGQGRRPEDSWLDNSRNYSLKTSAIMKQENMNTPERERMKRNSGAGQQINESDLVESILRKILNSAGISPPKKSANNPVAQQNQSQQNPLFDASNSSSLIKPKQVEYNYNEGNSYSRPRQEPEQKYHMGNFRNVYGGGYGTQRNEELEKKSGLTTSSSYGHIKTSEIVGKSFAFQHPILKQHNKPEDKWKPRTESALPSQNRERPSVGWDIKSTRSQAVVKSEYPTQRDSVSQGLASPNPARNMEDPTELRVEDRFEMAMQRSKRSVGFMKDIATKINSRNTSVEPDTRNPNFGRGSHVSYR